MRNFTKVKIATAGETGLYVPYPSLQLQLFSKQFVIKVMTLYCFHTFLKGSLKKKKKKNLPSLTQHPLDSSPPPQSPRLGEPPVLLGEVDGPSGPNAPEPGMT